MGGYCLGVDIGTTFSAVAAARDGRAEVVALGHHTAAMPSLVFLREDGSWLVGEPAGRRGLVEPGRLAREFKRRFGDTTPIILGGAPWSADALTAQLLRHLVEAAAAQLGSAPDRVAVTHPANWGPYKTDLLRQAVRSVGLPGEEPLLIPEPEAAALHYAASERVEVGEVVAVYDLGGGTFDAAVVARTADGFTLAGEPEGIERLGGIDFDQAVLAHVAGFLGDALSDLDADDPTSLAAMARLRSDCTAAKEALSADTEVSIPVLLPSLQTEIRLTRVELETMVRPPLADTIVVLERSIRSAGVEPSGVRAVLLVGGSSRIPLVGQLVSTAIGRPVAIDVHPKYAVALGAALAAAGVTGTALGPAPAVVAGPVQEPEGAAAVGAAATGKPASGDRGEDGPAPPPGAEGRRRHRPAWARPGVLAGAAAAVVAVIALVALLVGGGGGSLFNGDGGGDSDEAAPPEVPTFDLDLNAVSLGPAGGSVWLGASDATVARFDVDAGRVAGTLRLGASGGYVAVAAGAGAVWAVDIDAGTLSRIDPATNAVTSTIPVGRSPRGVIVADGAVWVAVEGEGTVLRIDPATGARTPVRVRGTPTWLAHAAGVVWVSDPANASLARIDTATNTIVGDGESGGCPGRLVAAERSVWVQDECMADTVFRLDPDTGRVAGSTTVGGGAEGMALAGGSLWVADGSRGTVAQLDAATGRLQRTVRVGPSPSEVVADGGSLWVLNSGDSTLSRIPL